MLLKWRDSYSTGVALFDREHQQLLQMINLIFAAIQHGYEKEASIQVIHEMLKYTRTHFAHEEELMERFAYQGAVEHREQHRELTSRVDLFLARFKAGEEGLAREVHAFLRDWFLKHILETDRRYGTFFLGKDLTLKAGRLP